MSQTGQTAELSRLQSFEHAPRPLVGYAHDYAAAHDTGWHQHPRAQLLYAIAGVLRAATTDALFVVPPGGPGCGCLPTQGT